MTTLITSIPKDTVLARLAALHAMPIAQLKQQWREMYGKEPPPFSRTYIQSRRSYRIQELAYGGLKPETVAKLEAIGEQLDGGNAIIRRIRHQDKPIAGTRLIREWKGVEHTVTVLQQTGINTVEQLHGTSEESLLRESGLGLRKVRQIKQGASTFLNSELKVIEEAQRAARAAARESAAEAAATAAAAADSNTTESTEA